MSTALYRPPAAVQPTPQQVADWVAGELRDGASAPARLAGLATLDNARPDEIAFVANDKAATLADQSQAGLLLLAEPHDRPGRPRVVVKSVWRAVIDLMDRLYPPRSAAGGIHPTAVVAPTAKLGAGVAIGPYCVVEDEAELGDGVELGPHCIVSAGCRIGTGCRLVARVTLVGVVFLGRRVTVHPGAVLGSDGFKYEVVDGAPRKVPQVGAVIIDDDAEIGANTTIDRAFLHETRVGRGVKIDNLVQIAHNVSVGDCSLLAALVGIAGSTRLGDGCVVGGHVGIADGLNIAPRTTVGGKTGLTFSVDEPGQTLFGYPARPIKQFWRIHSVQARLPEMARRLAQLEAKLQSLEAARQE
ncbi:MAG TPA: UDP-3-O-(3-hydroxymyristoyl)glucosamine N-acyltransferase [Candidatus Sumerlaeota bacterium]|nr:UDP-3-O-(3-hydroxymyristoyl)glucosamine N-acyltransferase [Candidatus Sumerlaeota bacterium]